MTLARVRSDALPENVEYRDTGCEVSPTCLTCPLVTCRFDDPGGLRGILNRERNSRIMQLRARGVGPRQVADLVGMSVRHVHRVRAAMMGATT